MGLWRILTRRQDEENLIPEDATFWQCYPWEKSIEPLHEDLG